MKNRFNLRLDDDLRSALSALPNASAYVRHSVRSRLERAQAAWTALRQLGFAPREVLAVADVLRGTLIQPELLPLSQTLPVELEDAGRLSNVAARHGISAERWAEVVEAARQEPVAFALLVLAEEVLAGNTSWALS